jgi:phage-related protein
MPDKPLIWLGNSRGDLRAFPALARRLPVSSCGASSRGLDPDDWKAMATLAEAAYVLHAFEKKTRKTSAHDLELGLTRFRALGKLRQQHGKEERR